MNGGRHSRSSIERLAGTLSAREPILAGADGSDLPQAAVALMLRERDGGLEVLVIRRADKEGDPWSGHMALPGGRREPGDQDAYDTARRETLEEIGLDLATGRTLGRLDDLGPSRMPRRLVVSPIVVALDAEPGRLEPREVVEAFWAPLEKLVESEVEVADFPGSFPAFTYNERYVIWGLTHRILLQLRKLLDG
jgi:8-oxo-dGTP pyrophosphatase MutT (NUDIX family)